MKVTLEKVYDVSKMIDVLYSKELLSTNIKQLKPNKKNTFGSSSFFDVEEYIYDFDINLKDIERKFSNRKNIKSYMIHIDLKSMPSKKIKKSIVKKTIDFFAEDSLKINYISLTKNNLITIFIFDRYFYPNGKKVEIRAKSNYQDGTVKGQVIRVEKRFLSDKLRIFNYSSKAIFEKQFEILRFLLKSSKQVKVLKHKVLKKLDNGDYINIVRVDNIYEEQNEWKYRKIRVLNMVLRLLQLNMIKDTDDKIKELKTHLNDYSVSAKEFESLALKLLIN